MGACRVVRPDTIRLPLSEGDWIDVVQELNAGEYYDLILAMSERKPFAKLVQYLIGWSLVGLDGKALPYSVDMAEPDRRATLRSLNKATIKELMAVIDRHDAAQEAAMDAKKKTPAGERGLSVISTSVA